LEGVDLGYALYSTFEKNGYAFEAASKMLDLAFREFNLSKVSGITTKENLASQRILKKLNLKESGTVQLENDPELLVLYELEREEYLANIEETE
jgi:RimJ/RimL family protein N-acetyltransferase